MTVNVVNEHYQDWLEDNDLEDSEENNERWFDCHCQFCGCSNEYGPCGCDHSIRY